MTKRLAAGVRPGVAGSTVARGARPPRRDRDPVPPESGGEGIHPSMHAYRILVCIHTYIQTDRQTDRPRNETEIWCLGTALSRLSLPPLSLSSLSLYLSFSLSLSVTLTLSIYIYICYMIGTAASTSTMSRTATTATRPAPIPPHLLPHSPPPPSFLPPSSPPPHAHRDTYGPCPPPASPRIPSRFRIT